MNETIVIWSLTFGVRYARLFRACVETTLRVGLSPSPDRGRSEG